MREIIVVLATLVGVIFATLNAIKSKNKFDGGKSEFELMAINHNYKNTQKRP